MNITNSHYALRKLTPHLNDPLASASKDTISEGYLIERAPEINSIQQNVPLNYFETSTTNAKPLNIPEEQKKDPVIRKVMDWIENVCTDDLIYASFELKRYHKHLMRRHIQKWILVRQFFDSNGKILHSQVCVPQHLRKEVNYRVHKSPTGGNLGIVRTAKEFRKRFYFPGFSEKLTDYNKKCFFCSTPKRVTKKQLHPPLQPVSSEQHFPGDMMQIDLVAPFQSTVYSYVLSGIDVFSKYIFAVSLSYAHAGTVAKALVSISFQHMYIPTKIVPD